MSGIHMWSFQCDWTGINERNIFKQLYFLRRNDSSDLKNKCWSFKFWCIVTSITQEGSLDFKIKEKNTRDIGLKDYATFLFVCLLLVVVQEIWCILILVILFLLNQHFQYYTNNSCLQNEIWYFKVKLYIWNCPTT
jgi:hypothetical protein